VRGVLPCCLLGIALDRVNVDRICVKPLMAAHPACLYDHYTGRQQTVRVATQNIQWGGTAGRLKRLIPIVASFDADVVVVTEYKAGTLGEELKDLLAQAGYRYFYSSELPSKSLGVAVGTRERGVRVDFPVPATTEPWRSIGLSIGGLDVFGFYFPFEDAKPLFWDWLLENAKVLARSNAILIGDFNTGKHILDETGRTFECSEKHEALEALGFVDVWRAAYPKGRDYTWYSSHRNGFRLDYLWASPSMIPCIKRVWHEHEPRLTASTDHSALVADIVDGRPIAGQELLGNEAMQLP
jgi:exonuclease III